MDARADLPEREHVIPVEAAIVTEHTIGRTPRLDRDLISADGVRALGVVEHQGGLVRPTVPGQSESALDDAEGQRLLEICLQGPMAEWPARRTLLKAGRQGESEARGVFNEHPLDSGECGRRARRSGGSRAGARGRGGSRATGGEADGSRRDQTMGYVKPGIRHSPPRVGQALTV